jgi:FkbM family methyltransferase
MAAHRNIASIVPFILSVVFLLLTYHRYAVLPHWGALQSTGPKPRYIFVDLGANGADSLEVFLQRENAKWQYDFPRPDWATHDQAGKHVRSTERLLSLNHASFTEIYLFEANPVFNTALVRAKEKYDTLGISVNIFPSTVVDTNDGTRTFFLDTVNTGTDFWGSSIYATHPDVVKSRSNGTELTSINLARWLLMNTLPRDFVVVKMDVEGAEYELVPHMAEMGMWTVVDHLLIEWHGIEVPEDKVLLAKAAVEKLKAEGVNLPSYDSWT